MDGIAKKEYPARITVISLARSTASNTLSVSLIASPGGSPPKGFGAFSSCTLKNAISTESPRCGGKLWSAILPVSVFIANAKVTDSGAHKHPDRDRSHAPLFGSEPG